MLDQRRTAAQPNARCERLFTERYEGLLAWAMELTNQPEFIKDLVQDAFVQFILAANVAENFRFNMAVNSFVRSSGCISWRSLIMMRSGQRLRLLRRVPQKRSSRWQFGIRFIRQGPAVLSRRWPNWEGEDLCQPRTL